MSRLSPQTYAEWRGRNGSALALRESEDSHAPAERLLQAVWHHQRLLRDQLRTLDGQSLRVLHPGFHNLEAGPDFRDAVLQFGLDAPRTGDVEVDLQPGHWRAHRHHQNPAFLNVLLHVVWEGGDAPETDLPTLALKPLLDAPLAELKLWLGTDAARNWPPDLAGQCCAVMSQMPVPVLHELLQQAARIRLQAKAAQFQARARQVGWEQSLWEGLFRALGYKHNGWPMQRLAELLPRLQPIDPQPIASALAWQARLLGLGGLLPVEAPPAGSDANRYLSRIWDHWWRQREAMLDFILPRGLWRFHGLRPANHPQRRLALAAHWLAAGDLPRRLESWFTQSFPDSALAGSLLELLQVQRDDFWSWHWTFRSAHLSKPQPMLGATRLSALAVNAILPWFWMRAVVGKNQQLQQTAEQRYFAWPRAEDNALLGLARQRLLGGAPARRLDSAADQQGMLQIVRDFCDRSNALCVDCSFPDRVRSLD